MTTRAHLFEERKREQIERGCRIEDERPIPVSGLCSFIAVRDLPVQDTLSALQVFGDAAFAVVTLQVCSSTLFRDE